jgi:hypothetical protein
MASSFVKMGGGKSTRSMLCITPLEASMSFSWEIEHCSPLPELQSQRWHVRWQNPPFHCVASGLTMKGKSHLPKLRCSAQVKLSGVGLSTQESWKAILPLVWQPSTMGTTSTPLAV